MGQCTPSSWTLMGLLSWGNQQYVLMKVDFIIHINLVRERKQAKESEAGREPSFLITPFPGGVLWSWRTSEKPKPTQIKAVMLPGSDLHSHRGLGKREASPQPPRWRSPGWRTPQRCCPASAAARPSGSWWRSCSAARPPPSRAGWRSGGTLGRRGLSCEPECSSAGTCGRSRSRRTVSSVRLTEQMASSRRYHPRCQCLHRLLRRNSRKRTFQKPRDNLRSHWLFQEREYCHWLR